MRRTTRRRALVLAGSAMVAGCEGLFGVEFDDVRARAVSDPRSDAAAADVAVEAVAPACEAGRRMCQAGCVADDDPRAGCGGDRCAPCETADHGESVCEAGRCAIACAPSYMRCTAGCCPMIEGPVAAGVTHTCATAASGALYCWGYNIGGQLGDNSREAKLRPSLVFGLEGGIRSVSVSTDSTCAVSGSGSTWVWGANTLGTLGDGTQTPRTTPVAPIGLATDARITVGGGSRACVITRTGSTWCWGYNPSGVVGTGEAALAARVPKRVVQTEPFAMLAAGTAHSCAIGISGALYCWGSNDSGQLGIGGIRDIAVPTRVDKEAGAISVAAGLGHTCIVTRAGGVRCWGNNTQGQLGVGDTSPRPDAVDVLAPSANARSVTAGSAYTCATLASGAVRCWGFMVSGVGVGSGSPDAQLRPIAVDLGGPAGAISAGARHACARMLDGRLRCWGANSAGQLGNGTNIDAPSPVDVALP